jgi:peptidoglycan/xylan/chitin deacetylase (PgdA/CDA1 family)
LDPFCEPLPEKTVAITFDDLPYTRAGDAGAQDLIDVAKATNDAIVAGLARYGAPATGFVVERRVQALGETGAALLEPWNAGRLELGNHSANHVDGNNLEIDAFRHEVISGEATIRPMVEQAGRTLRFFRFPYNHVGDTQERREGFERVLHERGYRLAASTIDTSDYIFDAAYERALARSDDAMARKIEDAYVDYSRVEIVYYANLSRQVFGCEPPAVMLLHVNRINAATIDRVLGLFLSASYRFVSLEDAQAHNAYKASPRTSTKFGPMWGYRWARERNIKVDGSREEEPPNWVVEYAE